MCDTSEPLCTPERVELEAQDCGFGNVVCDTQKAFKTAMYELGDQIIAGTKQVLASVGTSWLHTPRIDVVNGSSAPGQTPSPLDVGVQAGEQAGGASITTVLEWVMWIALGICVLSLIVAGVRMAWHARGGEAQQHADRLGTILFATILISGGTGLVTGVMRSGNSMGSTGVAFIQNATWWYTVAFGMVGVFVAGIKMAWEQRADAGKDLLRSLLTLMTVSAIGLSVISYLQFAGDEYAKWIIGKSLECQPATGACFADKLILMMFVPGAGGLGIIMVIIFAIIALLVSVIQIVLLIIRNGLLIILAGVLPLSAAATNTAVGKQMFSKVTGWIIGFLLYKPVAATIYAAAFKIAEGPPENAPIEKIILATLTGITLMIMSLIALPAMMSLIVPAVGNVTGGGGGAAGVAAAALPTGAMMLSKGSGGGGGSAGGAGKGPSGAAAAAAGGGGASKGPSGNSAPAGGGNSGGGGAGSPATGGGPQGAQGGSQGSAAGGGGSEGSSNSSSSGGSSPSGAASGGDQGGGSPGASGGAAGGSTSGGPSGAENSASGGNSGSASAALMAAQAGVQAAQGAADEATGAGSEPDGSQQQ